MFPLYVILKEYTSQRSNRLGYQNQAEQHLLSMMRTNLLPPLQTQSLSEMKGKLCYCNPSKWPAPSSTHVAMTIDLHSHSLSLCLPLFLNLSSSLPLLPKPLFLDFKHVQHFIPAN